MGAAKRVFVTGGAGYVGSVLVPKLLGQGHKVKVLDLCIFGEEALDSVKGHKDFVLVKGDMRDRALLEREIPGSEAVIHLACISNDPSFELNPKLGKSINYDCFPDLVDVSKRNKVSRFIYASSSSVYGIKDEENVTEDLALKPLTDYSKYKALCEDILLKERAPGFAALILRPATVCGYSPRLRLDLTVNILTNHAVNSKKIKVFGGDQKRPNIHIEDVTDLYVQALEWPESAIDGRIFNAGYENHTVRQIAEMVRRVVGDDVAIETTPTDDHRSYHISSEKIRRELGFAPRRTIEDAAKDLLAAFRAGKIPNSMTDSRYFNIKRMQELNLK
ncbi:MAG: NAD-dependent epimerase/dehydratase family protein [Planctomycetota bacterium]|nr:NAD-dependent epimerase/dehydratase family protein [Planctomycetota bacterium]